MRLPMSNQNTELAESLQNYTANIFCSRHGGNNGKQTIVEWYTSVRIGETPARVIGVNPKLSITIGNFLLVK